jgi:hypothetical protein
MKENVIFVLLALSFWLALLNMMISSSIYLSANNIISFFFMDD